jgi:ferredoxin
MSRSEGDFLLSCIRCNACVAACPTGILKTAGLEHGLRAWWSPVMVPVEGPCRSGCNACSQACPTDAIAKYPVEQKYAVKAGTAVLETSRCISYTENKFCSECIRACPTAAIAIAPGWKPAPQESDEGGAPIARGTDEPAPQGQTAERPAQVRFDACIGCGACEYACNQIVVGNPAMVTTAFGRGIPSNVPAAPIVS